MQMSLPVRITRFAQLSSGDLFMYRHSGGPCVGFVAENPLENGEKLVLPLGPEIPPDMRWPTLQTARGFTAISFGQSFSLRLPANASGWSYEEPPPESRTILVVDDKPYFRADCSLNNRRFLPCFVDMSTGLIVTTGAGISAEFGRPAGTSAFAIQWELTTNEDVPRVILACHA
jgi:hypothetical protein